MCTSTTRLLFFSFPIFFFFFRNLKRERNEKKSKAKQSVCFVLLCLCLCDRNGVVVLLMLNAKKYSIFNNELGLVFD